jgi:hypothetical protein
MIKQKVKRRKRCKNCGEILNAIWFTALMTEEWVFNGDGYCECSARHSLITDYDCEVTCPDCGGVVGTGRDFGFADGYKR